MYLVNEGLMITVLSVHLVLLFFIARLATRFSQRLQHHIRRLLQLAITIVGTAHMDCDELIDERISCGPFAADVLEQPNPAPARPAAKSDICQQQSCQELEV